MPLDWQNEQLCKNFSHSNPWPVSQQSLKSRDRNPGSSLVTSHKPRLFIQCTFLKRYCKPNHTVNLMINHNLTLRPKSAFSWIYDNIKIGYEAVITSGKWKGHDLCRSSHLPSVVTGSMNFSIKYIFTKRTLLQLAYDIPEVQIILQTHHFHQAKTPKYINVRR